MESDRGGVYRRLAITLGLTIAALLIARIPVPGVDFGALKQLVEFDDALMGILSIELRPFMTAAQLVELLALFIASWRVLRLGGYPERQLLWKRVVIIGFLLATVHAFFIVRWIRATPDVHVYAQIGVTVAGSRNNPLWIATQTFSIVGGTFLLFWFARLVDNYGVGSGFSLMIVAFMIIPAAQAVYTPARHLLENGERILLPLLVAGVAVAAIIRLTGGRPLRAKAASPASEELPIPASGLQAVVLGVSAVQLPEQVARIRGIASPGSLVPGTWAYRGAQTATIAVFCILLTWLFNRPRLIAETWRRAAPDADAARMKDRVRGAFARGLAWSLVVCCGVTAVEWFCSDAQMPISIVNAATIMCVLADIAGELRFRFRHGAVVRLWPVHRLYVLPAMLQALETAGIPAFPRGRRYRTLWNFLAPFVPVDILVPAKHAERALTIVGFSR